MTNPRARYLALMQERPDLFRSDPQGVRLVLDPAERDEVERQVAERMEAAGHPRSWAEAGLHYEDPWIWLIRDAVIFPDGTPGVHHRVVYRGTAGEFTGVAALPVCDGQLVLVRHYRHATGGWELEIPRGGVEECDPEAAMRTELHEEIGAEADELVPLGPVCSASALSRGRVLVYLARIGGIGEPARGEGIAEVLRVSVKEFETMLASGLIRDAFALAAFTHARLRGLL